MKLMAIGMLLTVLLTVANVNSVRAQQPAADNITETQLHSAIMNEDRKLIIHLPRNYSKDTSGKYPVMYVLDGTSQDQHTFDKITVLSDAGLIPSAIVVGLPNTRGNRERDQTPPFMRRDVNDPNSAFGAGDKFLSFIEKELIPYVESNYRTSGYRAISGNSRGGLFVLYSLIEKPDLFQARFCYSTPVWRFDDLMVHKTAEFLRHSRRLRGFLYVSVGAKETEQMLHGFDELVKILKKNRSKQFRWAADHTAFAVHQDNALISTSRGLAEWGKYLEQVGKKCDKPLRGRYVNSAHGYSFTVPTGYGGQWQSPCAYDEKLRDCVCIGNHGLYIAITDTSGINVFSGYPVELDEERPAQASILASMVAKEREEAKELSATSFRVESVQVRNNWARRVSMNWVDAASNRKMKKISYQLVTMVHKTAGESAEVTVSLVAPEDDVVKAGVWPPALFPMGYEIAVTKEIHRRLDRETNGSERELKIELTHPQLGRELPDYGRQVKLVGYPVHSRRVSSIAEALAPLLWIL